MITELVIKVLSFLFEWAAGALLTIINAMAGAFILTPGMLENYNGMFYAVMPEFKVISEQLLLSLGLGLAGVFILASIIGNFAPRNAGRNKSLFYIIFRSGFIIALTNKSQEIITGVLSALSAPVGIMNTRMQELGQKSPGVDGEDLSTIMTNFVESVSETSILDSAGTMILSYYFAFFFLFKIKSQITEYAFEMAERYIILVVLIMFAPVIIPLGILESKSTTVSTYFEMVFSHTFVMATHSMFLIPIINAVKYMPDRMAKVGTASGSSGTLSGTSMSPLLLTFIIISATITIATRFESHMQRFVAGLHTGSFGRGGNPFSAGLNSLGSHSLKAGAGAIAGVGATASAAKRAITGEGKEGGTEANVVDGEGPASLEDTLLAGEEEVENATGMKLADDADAVVDEDGKTTIEDKEGNAAEIKPLKDGEEAEAGAKEIKGKDGKRYQLKNKEGNSNKLFKDGVGKEIKNPQDAKNKAGQIKKGATSQVTDGKIKPNDSVKTKAKNADGKSVMKNEKLGEDYFKENGNLNRVSKTKSGKVVPDANGNFVQNTKTGELKDISPSIDKKGNVVGQREATGVISLNPDTGEREVLEPHSGAVGIVDGDGNFTPDPDGNFMEFSDSDGNIHTRKVEVEKDPEVGNVPVSASVEPAKFTIADRGEVKVDGGYRPLAGLETPNGNDVATIDGMPGRTFSFVTQDNGNPAIQDGKYLVKDEEGNVVTAPFSAVTALRPNNDARHKGLSIPMEGPGSKEIDLDAYSVFETVPGTNNSVIRMDRDSLNSDPVFAIPKGKFKEQGKFPTMSDGKNEYSLIPHYEVANNLESFEELGYDLSEYLPEDGAAANQSSFVDVPLKSVLSHLSTSELPLKSYSPRIDDMLGDDFPVYTQQDGKLVQAKREDYKSVPLYYIGNDFKAYTGAFDENNMIAGQNIGLDMLDSFGNENTSTAIYRSRESGSQFAKTLYDPKYVESDATKDDYAIEFVGGRMMHAVFERIDEYEGDGRYESRFNFKPKRQKQSLTLIDKFKQN